MVLDSKRDKADGLLMPIARSMSGVNPNSLSVISLICALLVLIVLVIWRDPLGLIVALILVLLNGFFDAIDGKVAKISGKASPRGDLVDHAIDRYADFFMIAGIALSAFADVRIGLIALGSVMIMSYMGTQSQALGLQRDYGGILGRAERIVLLLIFLPLQYIFVIFYQSNPHIMIVTDFSLTLLDVLMLVFIVGANVTAAQRFVRIWRALGKA